MRVCLIVSGIIAALISSSGPMEADFFIGSRRGILGYGLGAVSPINVVYDQSVGTKGYTEIYNTARGTWNGISNNISITAPQSPTSTHDTLELPSFTLLST